MLAVSHVAPFLIEFRWYFNLKGPSIQVCQLLQNWLDFLFVTREVTSSTPNCSFNLLISSIQSSHLEHLGVRRPVLVPALRSYIELSLRTIILYSRCGSLRASSPTCFSPQYLLSRVYLPSRVPASFVESQTDSLLYDDLAVPLLCSVLLAAADRFTLFLVS